MYINMYIYIYVYSIYSPLKRKRNAWDPRDLSGEFLFGPGFDVKGLQVPPLPRQQHQGREDGPRRAHEPRSARDTRAVPKDVNTIY